MVGILKTPLNIMYSGPVKPLTTNYDLNAKTRDWMNM